MPGRGNEPAAASLLIVAPGLVDESGGLKANASVLEELLAGLLLPGFDSLFKQADPDALRLSGTSPEELACGLFGLNAEADADVPLGAVLYSQDFGEAPPGFCFAAEPVFMEAGLRDVVLHRAAVLELSEAHTAALVDSLNQYFEADGWRFVVGNAGRWYALPGRALSVTTHSPDVPSGQRLEDLLPKGGDAKDLHRMLNEAQMLLHNHPVNLERAAKRQQPVNGVWLWGGGSRPDLKGETWGAVFTNDGLASSFARAMNAQVAEIGSLSATLEAKLVSTRTLVFDSRARDMLMTADFGAWRDWLEQFDREVLVPALQGIAAGQFSKVTLSSGPVSLCCRRRWRWPWTRWGRRRKLSDLVAGDLV